METPKTKIKNSKCIYALLECVLTQEVLSYMELISRDLPDTALAQKNSFGAKSEIAAPDDSSSQAASFSEPTDASLQARSEAEKISQPMKMQKSFDDPQITKKRQAFDAFNKASSFGASIGSKALNFAGFVGASLASLSYMFFNLKTVALILGLPSGALLYGAYRLKRKSLELNNSVVTNRDPVEVLQKASEDSLFLEKNLQQVKFALVQVRDMSDKKPEKQKAIDYLQTIHNKILARYQELEAINASDHELYTYKEFLSIYNNSFQQTKDEDEDFE